MPLLVAAGAVIAGLVLSGGLRASGRAAGRRVAEQYRQSVTAQLDRSIERRLGDDLARYLRRRAELAAALATVRLEVALTR